MEPISPKQREIQQRRLRILGVGFRLMRTGGLEAIRLEQIASQIGCTRGTLYNSFKNREEILVAMASHAAANRLDLFQHAVQFAETSREKAMSICIAMTIYADELPLDFAIEQAIRHESIWQRSSETSQEVFSCNEMACMRLAGEVINLGIANRDLPLPAGLTVEQMIERVAFGLWSMSFGGLVIEASSPSLENAGIRDVRSTIHYNCNALLDSYCWQPLFDALDYQAFLNRLTPVIAARAQTLAADHVADSPAEATH